MKQVIQIPLSSSIDLGVPHGHQPRCHMVFRFEQVVPVRCQLFRLEEVSALQQWQDRLAQRSSVVRAATSTSAVFFGGFKRSLGLERGGGPVRGSEPGLLLDASGEASGRGISLSRGVLESFRCQEGCFDDSGPPREKNR